MGIHILFVEQGQVGCPDERVVGAWDRELSPDQMPAAGVGAAAIIGETLAAEQSAPEYLGDEMTPGRMSLADIIRMRRTGPLGGWGNTGRPESFDLDGMSDWQRRGAAGHIGQAAIGEVSEQRAARPVPTIVSMARLMWERASSNQGGRHRAGWQFPTRLPRRRQPSLTPSAQN